MVKRRFPYWIQKELQRTEWLKKPLAKVVDFEPLGALLGPGAPDADLAPIRLRSDGLTESMSTMKPL